MSRFATNSLGQIFMISPNNQSQPTFYSFNRNNRPHQIVTHHGQPFQLLTQLPGQFQQLQGQPRQQCLQLQYNHLQLQPQTSVDLNNRIIPQSQQQQPQPGLSRPHPRNQAHLILPTMKHQPKVEEPQRSESPRIKDETISRTKEDSSTRIRCIKEKSIHHYIDGQVITETTKSCSEEKDHKLSSSKKRKKTKSLHIQMKLTQREQSVSKEQQKIEVQSQPSSSPAVQERFCSNIDSVADSHSESQKIARLRMEMPKWSVNEVVKFIEEHEDIKQYSSKFSEDEVDGKALLLMIDRNLNFKILTSMFKHGPAMKIEAALSKYKTLKFLARLRTSRATLPQALTRIQLKSLPPELRFLITFVMKDWKMVRIIGQQYSIELREGL